MRPSGVLGRVAICLLAGVVAGGLACESAGAVDVESKLNRLVKANALGPTRVAVYVVDLTSGQTLAAVRANEPMIPASNMKLLTTAAALDTLGVDFVFETKLGIIEQDGAGGAGGAGLPSLVIMGDGDPAFGDPELMKLSQPPLDTDMLIEFWVDAVQRTGHTRFARLVVDDRVFDRRFIHEDWEADDLYKHYGAQVAGLNIHLNTLDVSVSPGGYVGQAPRVTVFPRAAFVKTTNRATTGRVDSFWVSRRPDTNELTFHGKVKTRSYAPHRMTIHDPPLFIGRLVAERLAAAGIVVDEVARPGDREALGGARLLHVVRTPLTSVLQRTNQDSVNLFAEALIKRSGRELTGRAGSWNTGAAAVREMLRRRLGPKASVVVFADGSGLSRNNRVTARVLVELLRSMHHDDEAGEIFRLSLAHGGRTGTLRRRMRQLDGDVFGKSGYISGASTLSGYLIVPDDEPAAQRVIAFSFLFNGFDRRISNSKLKALQDQMLQTIENAVHAEAKLGG